MDPTELLNYFASREGEILGAIRELVDIESPSHDAVRSRVAADRVAAMFSGISGDIETERLTVEDGDHLVIRCFPDAGTYTMVLGHTDTVHPVGTASQNPTRVDGDRFYGCGIFDMKANIVLMAEAIRVLATETKRSPITIFLSCDEEVGSFSGRAILERIAGNAKRCFVFEPSADGRAKTGRKGTGMFTVRAHGVPAHAGLEPEKGASAIVELARQVEQIQRFNDRSAGTTVNVTTIRGGTTSNVIPEHAECEVDVRFTSIAESDRVDTAIRALRALDLRVQLEVSGGINRPPMERTGRVIELFEQAKSLAAGIGYDLDETQVGGASDGNFVAAMGVPVLDGLGIRGAGAHTLGEHILVSDVLPRAALMTRLLGEID